MVQAAPRESTMNKLFPDFLNLMATWASAGAVTHSAANSPVAAAQSQAAPVQLDRGLRRSASTHSNPMAFQPSLGMVSSSG